MRKVSFRKILKHHQFVDEEGCSQAAGLFIRHYYFLIFCLLLVTGLLNGGTFTGTAYYLIATLATILFVLTALGVGVHRRKAHKVRAVVNGLCLVGLMLLEAASNLGNAPKEMKIGSPAIGIVLLATCLTTTLAVLIRIEYSKHKARKRRESKVSK